MNETTAIRHSYLQHRLLGAKPLQLVDVGYFFTRAELLMIDDVAERKPGDHMQANCTAWNEIQDELQAVVCRHARRQIYAYTELTHGYLQRLSEYQLEKLLRKYAGDGLRRLIEDVRDVLGIAPRPDMQLEGKCRA